MGAPTKLSFTLEEYLDLEAAVARHVRADDGQMYLYPDLLAFCGEPAFESHPWHGLTAFLNPQVIIEVPSPSTESFDRGEKFRAYRQIETLTDYLLISTSEPLVEQYIRRPNGVWTREGWAGPEVVLRLASTELPHRTPGTEARRNAACATRGVARGHRPFACPGSCTACAGQAGQSTTARTKAFPRRSQVQLGNEGLNFVGKAPDQRAPELVHRDGVKLRVAADRQHASLNGPQKIFAQAGFPALVPLVGRRHVLVAPA